MYKKQLTLNQQVLGSTHRRVTTILGTEKPLFQKYELFLFSVLVLFLFSKKLGLTEIPKAGA